MSADLAPLPTATIAPSASPIASTSAEPDRATAFRAVTVNAETVNGGNLLIAAYAVVWVVVLLAVVRVFQRQTAIATKLDQLEGDVARGREKR